MLNEGNQIHNFLSSSGSGTVINYGSGSSSDFLTSYGSGSGSTSQKVTVPTVPVPVPQRCIELSFSFIELSNRPSVVCLFDILGLDLDGLMLVLSLLSRSIQLHHPLIILVLRVYIYRWKWYQVIPYYQCCGLWSSDFPRSCDLGLALKS